MRGAFENHRQAVFWLEQNISRVPSNDAKFELARTLNLQGSISDRMGTAGLPPTPPMDRPSKKNPLPVRPPRFGPPPMFFGFAESNERALGLLNELVATEPKNVEYRLELAQCHSNSARRARLSGDLSGTSQSMETAVGLLEQLARDHPHDPRLQYELADTLLFSASLASSSTNDENVQGRIQSALAICERLGVAYPNVPDYKALLANALGKTAAALLAAGESDGAQRSYERAVEYEQRLVADFPAMTRYRVAYSRTLLELAELHRRGGRFDAAQQHLMRAVRDLESAGSAFAYRQVLGRLYRSLAETLAQKGETARAEEFREKARAATSLPRDFGRKKGRE
jgi:tetratricopeptide (TPR) repeat protein